MKDPKNWGAQVYDHALANYDKDGWDYIVECSEIAELDEETMNCRSLAGAIKLVRKRARLLDERRREVMSTVW